MKQNGISDDNKGFWDRCAKRYDFIMSKDGRIYEQIVGRMKKVLDRKMTVLELACGTGLLSVQLAGNVKQLEATDFSEEMIRQAKAKAHSFRLHFSVQDATRLPYAPGTFDAVVISNALHIMPEPEKALTEIRRVLKTDGILIAPAFTAAGSLSGRIRIRLMELSGFKVFHKWTPEEYLDFLKANGFEITCGKTFDGGLKLTYAEARVDEKTAAAAACEMEHTGLVCNASKKQKPHDPKAPYDGYDESDDTREKAKTVRLEKALPVK